MKMLLRTLSLATLVATPAFAQDSDGDSVSDQLDAFPCDGTVSGVSYAPGQGQHSVLLFEDMWPQDGDLDFNDVVLATNFAFKTDSAGRVISLRATYNLLAAGGVLHTGIGLRLPVPRGSVASVTRTVGAEAPQALSLEVDAEATVLLIDKARRLVSFYAAENNVPMNADPALPVTTARPMQIDVVFSAPVALTMGAAPFDTFIFHTFRRGREVHLPQYQGTTAIEGALFATGDDTSTNGRWFTGTNGLPFALLMPTYRGYPREGVSISTMWPDIVAFAQSGGTTATDFMTSTVDSSAGFSGGPQPSFVAADTFTVDSTCVPPPTCTDGYQNQGETGVDCGGPCGSCVTVATSCPTDTSTPLPASCAELAAAGAGTGTYCIDADGPGAGEAPLVVYCDQDTAGGGWTALTNVTSSGPTYLSSDTRSGTDYIAPLQVMAALQAGATEVRYHCASSGGAVIDVSATADAWITRPTARGDGCGNGYRYAASADLISLLNPLPGNNGSYNGPGYGGGCCCRPNYPVGVMTVGFGQSNWFMYDPYYRRAWPTCAGGGATFMRIYYR